MSNEIETINHPDRVEQLYDGKTVFITGGTGFLGKVLIEKLLRACPNVKQIIALVRTKKGKAPKKRMEEVLNGPLFDSLKKQWGPDQTKKVKVVEGDITKEGLGLSKEDWNWLCEEAQIVFHGAATIRFDLPLKSAVLMNVKGTKHMLDLAKEMRKLEIFQHISTAYCHLEEKELFERAYPPPADPHHILKLCELLKEEDLELITPKLLKNSPNTYAFTKALSEALIEEQMENLPVLILRPSVVIPIWQEPIPGWTDNLNGPAGLLLGAGKGVIRTMYIKQDAYSDYIPVDVVANALILMTFFRTINPQKRIYHITCNEEVRVSYEEIIEMGRKIIETKVPLPGVAWYPGGSTKRSKLYNKICVFLYHLIPAMIVDTILFILGYEPVLMRVQRRVAKGCEVLEYYANNQWTFNNKESLEFRKVLNPTEKKKYKIDKDGFDYGEYMTNCVISIRRYMLNEPDDTIPDSKRRMMVMWVLDRTFKMLLLYACLIFLYRSVYLRFFN